MTVIPYVLAVAIPIAILATTWAAFDEYRKAANKRRHNPRHHRGGLRGRLPRLAVRRREPAGHDLLVVAGTDAQRDIEAPTGPLNTGQIDVLLQEANHE